MHLLFFLFIITISSKQLSTEGRRRAAWYVSKRRKHKTKILEHIIAFFPSFVQTNLSPFSFIQAGERMGEPYT